MSNKLLLVLLTSNLHRLLVMESPVVDNIEVCNGRLVAWFPQEQISSVLR